MSQGGGAKGLANRGRWVGERAGGGGATWYNWGGEKDDLQQGVGVTVQWGQWGALWGLWWSHDVTGHVRQTGVGGFPHGWCNRYRLLFGFEYRLILSMFYD